MRGRLKTHCQTCEHGRLTLLVRSIQHFKREIRRVYYNKQNLQILGTVCGILVDSFRLKISRWLELKTKYMNVAEFWICMRGRLKMYCQICEHGRLNLLVMTM